MMTALPQNAASEDHPPAMASPPDAAKAKQTLARNRRRAWLRWAKRLALMGLVLAVVALLVVAWLPKPVPVDIVVVSRGAMQVTVDEDGRARVRDRYVVGAPLSGRVARIELTAGDAVERETIIARIAPLQSPLLDERSKSTSEAQVAAAQAAKGQTKAQIARAEASLAYASSEAERVKKLREGQAVAERDLDQAVLAKRTAAAELESLKFAARVADHELRMARAALSRSSGDGEQLEVPSPGKGRVLKVFQVSEGVVQAGTPLLELGDPSALEIVVDVLTRDAVRVSPGAKVTIDRWGGPPLAGRVRLVEPSAFTRLSALGVEEQRVNVIIDLDAPHAAWAALGDGYRIEAKIVVWEADDVVLVPASAVFRHESSWAVYRIVDGKAQLTTVAIDHRNALSVEVTEGLEAGASIVLFPGDRVTDGVAVVAR